MSQENVEVVRRTRTSWAGGREASEPPAARQPGFLTP
jgi:hypothetical protein